MIITPTPEIPGQIAGSGKEILSVRQCTNNFRTIYAKMYSEKVKYNKKKNLERRGKSSSK